MLQLIIKINATFPASSSTCRSDKTEPVQVMSLSSISSTPAASARCRSSMIFLTPPTLESPTAATHLTPLVISHAWRKVEIRGGGPSLMDSQMKRLRRELLIETSICPFYAKAFGRDGSFELSNKGQLKKEMLALNKKKKKTCFGPSLSPVL